MSLLNLIVNAIDNPEQEASADQLIHIAQTLQKASDNTETSVPVLESAMSILGKHTKSVLQQKRNQEGEASVEDLVNQYGGNHTNSEAVSSIFSNDQLGRILAEISARTGINENNLKSLIPLLLPLVLNLLKTGNRNSNYPMSNQPNYSQNRGQNSVLSGFLDTDGDGDVDIMDALSLARRYL